MFSDFNDLEAFGILVWPQRGTWLQRTTARSAGCAVVRDFVV
jgi:hypothetical protein